MASPLERPEWAEYLNAQQRSFAHSAARPSSSDWDAYQAWQTEAGRLSDIARDLQRRLLADLQADDVPALLDAVEGDAISSEQRAVVFVLNDLARQRDARMTASMRERWAQSLERKMAASYPSDASPYTFLNWIDADRAKASLQAAVDKISLHTLTDAEAGVVIRDAPALGATGIEILRRLAGRVDEVGKRALAQLERVVPPSAERIEEVAARWREFGARDEINWLYNYVISRFGEGNEPIERVRAWLGEPTQTHPDMCYWETREEHAIGLAIGFNRDGNIISYKLT